MFATYIEQVLGPILCAGDVIVLNNPGSHKSQIAQVFVESRFAGYLFFLHTALGMVTADDVQGCFASCGYVKL